MRNEAVIKIAMKNLLKKRKRSIITIGAMAVAICVVTFFIALGFGVQDIVVEDFASSERIRTIDVVANKSKNIVVDSQQIKEFESIEGVEKVFPIFESSARIEYNGSVTDVLVLGLSADALRNWQLLLETEESKLENFDKTTVFLSETAQNLIGVQNEDLTGDQISAEIAYSTADSEEDLSFSGDFEILGIVDKYDSPLLIIPIDFTLENGVAEYTLARIVTLDQDDVAKVRVIVEREGFSTTSTLDTIEQIDEVFTIVRYAITFFGSIAIFIAVLGMFNTLTISLLEKTREVGIMKALGSTRKIILKLFLAESIIIALVGGVSGMVLSVLFSFFTQLVFEALARSRGQEIDNLFIYPIEIFIIFFLVTLFLGVFTGIFPSRRAASIKTTDALRYE